LLHYRSEGRLKVAFSVGRQRAPSELSPKFVRALLLRRPICTSKQPHSSQQYKLVYSAPQLSFVCYLILSPQPPFFLAVATIASSAYCIWPSLKRREYLSNASLASNKNHKPPSHTLRRRLTVDMVNSVLRGAGRLANTMFGRSNSLSINTGAANSTLYASSPPLTSSSPITSPPIHPTQIPRRSGPSLLGASVYSHKPTPGPSSLRNEWSDAPPDPSLSRDHRTQHPHGSKEAAREVTATDAPWLDPKWTVPAGSGAMGAGAQSTATGNNAPPPPPPQAGPAFGTQSNNFLPAPPTQPSASVTQSSSVFAPLPTQSSAFGTPSSNVSTPLPPTQSSAFGTQSSNVHHLHMRQLSGLSQTLCRCLNLRQPLGPNQTMSCHLFIRPLQSLVKHQSFPTRRHRLTSRIRGRLRKRLANGSTVLSARLLLPYFLTSIRVGSCLPHRRCRHARKSDLCTKDGSLLTLQINSFDLI
jgi:hypothetical protein